MKGKNNDEGVLTFHPINSKNEKDTITAIAFDRNKALEFVAPAEAISKQLKMSYRIAHFHFVGDLNTFTLTTPPAVGISRPAALSPNKEDKSE